MPLFSSFYISLIAIVAALLIYPTRQAPGLVYTDAGYDIFNGTEAICWVAPSAKDGGIKWKNVLQPDFLTGTTEMLDSCPANTNITMEIVPQVLYEASELYRIHRSYTYHVHASVDLSEIRSTYNLSQWAFFESADGLHEVAIRILYCPVNGDFCSPFLAERINETTSIVDGTIAHNHETPTTRRFLSLQEDQEILNELASPVFVVPVSYEQYQDEDIIDFDVDIQTAVHEPGNYVPLASLQFFLSNDTPPSSTTTSVPVYKFDMANLLPQRSVHFYDPLVIESVSLGVEVFTYCIIALSGIIQVALLGCTIYYRKESVMTLSQGGFLIALQIAGIIATLSSIFYNPTSDAFCFLQSPCTMIPLQFMFAVVFGRLLRILTIMAPLLGWNKDTTKQEMRQRLGTWKQNFMVGRASSKTSSQASSTNGGGSSSLARDSSLNADSQVSQDDSSRQPEARSSNLSRNRDRFSRFLPSRRQRQQRHHSLRREFSKQRLSTIIFLVTLPMIIVEIVGLAVFTPQQTISMNESESAGRYECGDHSYHVYQISSTAVIVITIFADLYQAHKSRKLPALFNEVESVTSALVVSVFVAILCFAVILVTEDPEASPSIPYLMEVVIIVNASMNLAVRLVVPKLRLIWKGEKVVISRVLAEHKKSKTQGFIGSSCIQSDAPSWAPPTAIMDGAANRTSEISRLDGCESTTSVVEMPCAGDEQDESTSTASAERLEVEDAPAVVGKTMASVKDESDGVDEANSGESGTKCGGAPSHDGTSEAGIVRVSAAEPISPAVPSGNDNDNIVPDSEGVPRKRISFSLPVVETVTTPATDVNSSAADMLKKRDRRKSTVIREGRQPPSRLVTELMSHHSIISRVTERILSGLQVSREDWEDVKRSVHDLDSIMESIEYK